LQLPGTEIASRPLKARPIGRARRTSEAGMALEYGIDLDEKIRTGAREIGLAAALREYRVLKAGAATGDDPLTPLTWFRNGKPPFDIEDMDRLLELLPIGLNRS
jgi:hypothetical protein